MDNDVRLFSQVAAEAAVSAESAMVACYLLSLSRSGKSLDDAATLMRKPRAEVRTVARDWGIAFPDYLLTAAPLQLVWEKVKRGRWELRLGDVLIGTADSAGAGNGSYIAYRDNDRLQVDGSSAVIAMTRLSDEIEKRSVDIFGVDDVQIYMTDADGSKLLSPKYPPNAQDMRRALAA